MVELVEEIGNESKFATDQCQGYLLSYQQTNSRIYLKKAKIY